MLNILSFIFFLTIISYCIAQLEIQIEGGDGWAKNLPTWRIRNKLTKILLGNSPLTGYHLWLLIVLLCFLHFPLVVLAQWKLYLELRILSLFFFIIVFEDLFWFICNPNYGINKFDKKYIPWHHIWFAKLPFIYYECSIVGIILFIFGFFIVKA